MSTQVVVSPNAVVEANTEHDISGELPEALDTRDGNDPIADATLKAGASDTSTADTTVLDTTELTSNGEVSADGPGAGEVGYVSGTSIALGDALNPTDLLILEVETRTEGRQVL